MAANVTFLIVFILQQKFKFKMFIIVGFTLSIQMFCKQINNIILILRNLLVKFYLKKFNLLI